MKLNVFECFAGYGSQSIALELLARDFPDLQFEVVGFAEIDRYAIQAYRSIHGDKAPNLGDVSKINWGGYCVDIDLLTYSFPCQDISSAGKQRGFSEGCGSRSSLLWECSRSIVAKRPKYLLMENVKALTQKKFAADFKRWRDWLESQGYTNYWQVLNAKDYGVPQNRERCFMVSILGEHQPFNFPRPFTLERRLKHVLETEVEEKYWLTQKQIEGILKHNDSKQAQGCGFKTEFRKEDETSTAVLTKYGNRPTDTYVKVPTYGNSRLNQMIERGLIDPSKVLWIDAYNKRVDPEVAGTITTRVNASSHYMVSDPRVVQVGNLVEGAKFSNPHRGRVYSAEGIAPCITTCVGGNLEPKILQRGHGFNPGDVYDVCPTITTSQWQCNNFAISEWWIRKLTPRECFRLMDVPEHYIDRMIESGISNSQLYKLAGNSIVVACLYHIFRKMFAEQGFEPVNGQLSLF